MSWGQLWLSEWLTIFSKTDKHLFTTLQWNYLTLAANGCELEENIKNNEPFKLNGYHYLTVQKLRTNKWGHLFKTWNKIEPLIINILSQTALFHMILLTTPNNYWHIYCTMFTFSCQTVIWKQHNTIICGDFNAFVMTISTCLWGCDVAFCFPIAVTLYVFLNVRVNIT